MRKKAYRREKVMSKSKRIFSLLKQSALLISLSSIPFSSVLGQTFDFSNLSISNQLEYSIENETHDEIIEDWFELRYQTEPFSFGARFEIFQPSERKNIPPDSTYEGFPFRYVEFQRSGIRITAGNFYDIFGRGIAFRSYENRDIRTDNSLDGLRVKVEKDIFDLTFLTGKMLSKNISGIPQERIDLLHAVNFETRLTDKFEIGPFQHLLVGTSILRQNPQDDIRREMATGRVEAGISNLYFYGEYGSKLNHPGSAIYLGTNLDLFGLGLSLEYKEYDQFALRTSDRRVDYNTPPALTKEHTYTLLSRNAYALNVNDEKGFQAEVIYSPLPMNTILLNFSQTKSLNGRLQFEEVYGEWSRYQGDWLYAVLAFGSQITQDVRSITPILELEFLLDERNSFRTELQHQHQKGSFIGEYDIDMLVAEYSRSPRWTFSLIGERNNLSDLQKGILGLPDNKTFIAVQASIQLSENHDLIVFGGSRQKGKVCVGGVCRTEPQFEGVEVRLFSRF
jgi:hypothetical protein